MRHAQHGTKAQKKNCRGMALTGPGQMIGSSKAKLKSPRHLVLRAGNECCLVWQKGFFACN